MAGRSLGFSSGGWARRKFWAVGGFEWPVVLDGIWVRLRKKLWRINFLGWFFCNTLAEWCRIGVGRSNFGSDELVRSPFSPTLLLDPLDCARDRLESLGILRVFYVLLAF